MSCVDIKNSDIAKDLQKLTENAFFDGQMSALKGEWYVKKDDSGKYVWDKNIWIHNDSDNKDVIELTKIYHDRFPIYIPDDKR